MGGGAVVPSFGGSRGISDLSGVRFLPGASKPNPDNLTGRVALANTQGAELSNARTQAEIDALRKELSLKESGQQFGQQNTTMIRDLLLKQFGGGAPIGVDVAPGAPSPSPSPSMPPPAPAPPPGADLGFARAKDRAGLNLQSGLKTLKSVMQRTGQAGSSIERDAVGGLIGGETARLGDVDVAQAAEGQRRGYQLEDRAHDDVWREREMADKTRMNGLQLLMSLMSGGRAY